MSLVRRTFSVAVLAGALVSAAWAAGPPSGLQGALDLSVVSSPPELVSGGDARVEVAVPVGVALSAVTVELDGSDVTAAFGPDPEGNHQLEGVVTGLPEGPSTLVAQIPGPGQAAPDRAELMLVNHSLDGPMFSGPRQDPFFCSTAAHRAKVGLGDILDPPTCRTATVVRFVYRSTTNTWKPYDPAAPRPADMATTTTLDGDTVDFIVRWETGTIDRFLYSIAILDPQTNWNGRLIYKFQGGVAIGHYQGDPSESEMLYLPGLAKGYAIAYSTGTKTGTHYNLQLGGETAIMVKDRFVSAYGEPLYTVGVGGSGGAIQQYVYGQNHPGLIDAGIPQYSYPDMVTQTIHIGDCELLERWADAEAIANPLSQWRTWLSRSLIEGLNSAATLANPYAPFMPYMPVPGSDECINGWRGLSPLALNPHFGTAPGITPAQQASVKWTHWDDLVNIYGADEHGYGRVPWDNVGVQYGLKALNDGAITPAEFLDLNANVGSWKPSHEMVQEACPYLSTNPVVCAVLGVDVWSQRNMNLSSDGGLTPAPRRAGDREAQYAAYRSGLVFRGKIDIPLIDWRNYLERRLDMHNSRQSFAARARMLRYDGDASNQVIWFTDTPLTGSPFDQTPMALGVIDDWMANIRAHPGLSVAENKPAAAVDSCFGTTGSLIASGQDVWAGILDDAPAGVCTALFPTYSTSRMVSGGPMTADIFSCQLQPVGWAIDHGLYAPWVPSAHDVARLEAIFPEGVCDYSKGDLGLPPELHAPGK
jgi:hypothetical protein